MPATWLSHTLLVLQRQKHGWSGPGSPGMAGQVQPWAGVCTVGGYSPTLKEKRWGKSSSNCNCMSWCWNLWVFFFVPSKSHLGSPFKISRLSTTWSRMMHSGKATCHSFPSCCFLAFLFPNFLSFSPLSLPSLYQVCHVLWRQASAVQSQITYLLEWEHHQLIIEIAREDGVFAWVEVES